MCTEIERERNDLPLNKQEKLKTSGIKGSKMVRVIHQISQVKKYRYTQNKAGEPSENETGQRCQTRESTAHPNISTSTRIYICACTCPHSTYIFVCICMPIYLLLYRCIFTHTHNVCVSVCAHINAYTHIYIM